MPIIHQFLQGRPPSLLLGWRPLLGCRPSLVETKKRKRKKGLILVLLLTATSYLATTYFTSTLAPQKRKSKHVCIRVDRQVRSLAAQGDATGLEVRM